jgi:predicted metal-dependent peptidase
MRDLGLDRDKCRKMTAEEIYAVLEQNKDAVKDEPQQPWGGEIEKPTNDDGSEMNQEQLEKLSKSIDRKIVQAGIKAKQVGAINQEIQDVLNRVEESKVEWQEAFTFAWQGGDNDSTYTYRKLNKKHLTWNAITPTIVGMSCGDVGVLQDTSASVDKKQRDRGFSEMNALSKDIKPDSITVIPFTSRVDVDGIKRFEKGEEIESLKINGTGGTKIRPAFQYIDENWQDFNFKKLVIFTDCEISDYGDEPQFDEPCEIIWVCCQSKEKLGSYYLPPYGTTIFIDD